MASRWPGLLSLCVTLFVAAIGIGCGDDKVGPAGDTTAPGPVTDLHVTHLAAGGVTLTWTAPGDDGQQGTAAEYDLRYSTEVITALNWESAALVPGLPAPQVGGTAESFAVTGLACGTSYHFALKTRDEVAGNWSGLSNVPQGETQSCPPADVLASLREAWQSRSAGGYARLLADDYRFYFDETTRVKDGLPVFWTRLEDSTGVSRLFSYPYVNEITVSLSGMQDPVPVQQPGREDWVMVDVLQSYLEVEIDPNPADPEGITLRVLSSLQHFYLRKGRTAADKDTLSSPTARRYFIVEWLDSGDVGEAPLGSRTRPPGWAGSPGQPVASLMTWGAIKAMFR